MVRLQQQQQLWLLLTCTENDQVHSDLQFEIFMQNVTDLSEDKITNVFDMLDVDHDGVIDFDEFYLLICIMTSFKVSSCL